MKAKLHVSVRELATEPARLLQRFQRFPALAGLRKEPGEVMLRAKLNARLRLAVDERERSADVLDALLRVGKSRWRFPS
jgi:hypothetical protein